MSISRKMCAGLFIAAFALAVGFSQAGHAAVSPEKKESIVEHGWSKRCDPAGKGGSGHCEIFARMDTENGSLRVAEFGIGFEKGQKDARGVVVLPLGIMLEPGVSMKIDDGHAALFKVRYCLNGGCFSYVNLDKEMLDSMKKGNKINFQFKSAAGKDVDLVMKLDGFSKALKDIQ